MQVIVVLAVVALFGAVVAQEVAEDIVYQENKQNEDGSFYSAFETKDGIKQSAQGTFKQVSPEEAAIVQEGASQYTSPEGEKVSIQWRATEEGYVAEGSHVPQKPEWLARAEQWRLAHPQPQERR